MILLKQLMELFVIMALGFSHTACRTFVEIVCDG